MRAEEGVEQRSWFSHPWTQAASTCLPSSLWMSGSRSGAQPIFKHSAILISPSCALPSTFSHSIHRNGTQAVEYAGDTKRVGMKWPWVPG